VARSPEVIEFGDDDRGAVLARMEELVGGGGWINLRPVLDPDVLPPRGSALFGIFSSRGPIVPLATWTPAGLSKRETYVSLGLQHGTGTKAAARLHDRGVPVADTWRVLRDSPKGGLVIGVPAADPNDDVLDWLLRAGRALAPIDNRGRWVALIHRPG
jgi:hypothetical protein